MLENNKVSEIVREVATANLTSKSIQDILIEPATDSEGHEALRITIVITPGAVLKLKGDAVLDTLVDIQRRLLEAGDERFPIVEYATEDELENSGGLKS